MEQYGFSVPGNPFDRVGFRGLELPFGVQRLMSHAVVRAAGEEMKRGMLFKSGEGGMGGMMDGRHVGHWGAEREKQQQGDELQEWHLEQQEEQKGSHAWQQHQQEGQQQPRLEYEKYHLEQQQQKALCLRALRQDAKQQQQQLLKVGAESQEAMDVNSLQYTRLDCAVASVLAAAGWRRKEEYKAVTAHTTAAIAIAMLGWLQREQQKVLLTREEGLWLETYEGATRGGGEGVGGGGYVRSEGCDASGHDGRMRGAFGLTDVSIEGIRGGGGGQRVGRGGGGHGGRVGGGGGLLYECVVVGVGVSDIRRAAAYAYRREYEELLGMTRGLLERVLLKAE